MTSNRTICKKHKTPEEWKVTIILCRIIIKWTSLLMNFIMFSYENSVVVKKFHDNDNKTLGLAQKRFTLRVPSRSRSWQSKRVAKNQVRVGSSSRKNLNSHFGVRIQSKKKTGRLKSESGVGIKKLEHRSWSWDLGAEIKNNQFPVVGVKSQIRKN